jgi:hypothetical protein
MIQCAAGGREAIGLIRETVTERQFQRQLERILAKVQSGVALREDVDAIAVSPEARLPHRWFTIWMERATSAQLEARQLLRVGQEAQAARLYLRASEYFRAAAAIYWPSRGDAAIADAQRLQVECFRAALDVAGPSYYPFEIGAGGVAVGGYLLEPAHATAPTQLALCCGPLDGAAEEQYALAGREAHQHGLWVALVNPDQLSASVAAPRGIEEALSGLRALAEQFGAERLSVLVAIEIGDGRWLTEELARSDPSIQIWNCADAIQGTVDDGMYLPASSANTDIEERSDG